MSRFIRSAARRRISAFLRKNGGVAGRSSSSELALITIVLSGFLITYLLLEEFLSQVTEYWAMIMGPLLLLIVLFGRGGIMGVIGRFSRG